jgi:hypothetical protein
MSKLSAEDKFIDLSDYGRFPAKLIARFLANTSFMPIQVTLVFGVVGLAAVFSILKGFYLLAAALLILKSIIDAADGELARLKNTPSYSGRYLDSVFDIILNFFFLMAIAHVSGQAYWLALVAFFAIQIQGTLYNYYYVIVRHRSVGGDATSKIFEYKSPTALGNESQALVNFLFKAYTILYGGFDKIVHAMDKQAYKVKSFPKWFMTLISMYGLGFHLLIMAILLSLNYVEITIPFLIGFTIPMFLFIGIRKLFLK